MGLGGFEFFFLLEEALLVLGIGTLRGMEGVGKEKGVKREEEEV